MFVDGWGVLCGVKGSFASCVLIDRRHDPKRKNDIQGLFTMRMDFRPISVRLSEQSLVVLLYCIVVES